MKKKLSKREKEINEKKKEFVFTNWVTFILGVVFCFVGFRRFFSGNITVLMNQKTKYPIMDNGSYPIFIGILLLVIGFYRILFLKRP